MDGVRHTLAGCIANLSVQDDEVHPLRVYLIPSLSAFHVCPCVYSQMISIQLAEELSLWPDPLREKLVCV